MRKLRSWREFLAIGLVSDYAEGRGLEGDVILLRFFRG